MAALRDASRAPVREDATRATEVVEAWRVAATAAPARAVAPYRSRPATVARPQVPSRAEVGTAEAGVTTTLATRAEAKGAQAARALILDQGLGHCRQKRVTDHRDAVHPENVNTLPRR